MRSFPGHSCPGLIEASSPFMGSPQTSQVFRGIHAPASLKPHPHVVPHDALLGFPGHSCPGLIEALRILASRTGVRPVFRGIHAPASLKRAMIQAGIPRALLVFRGIHAPASLKRIHTWDKSQ